MEEIIKIIKEHKLIGVSKGYSIFFPRMWLMNWICDNTCLTRVSIGELFGRDHSTIIYCIDRHKGLTSYGDKQYIQYTQRIRERLEGRKMHMSTITDDILSCDTLTGLAEIKRKLEAGAYIYSAYAGDRITYELEAEDGLREASMGEA